MHRGFLNRVRKFDSCRGALSARTARSPARRQHLRPVESADGYLPRGKRRWLAHVRDRDERQGRVLGLEPVRSVGGLRRELSLSAGNKKACLYAASTTNSTVVANTIGFYGG